MQQVSATKPSDDCRRLSKLFVRRGGRDAFGVQGLLPAQGLRRAHFTLQGRSESYQNQPGVQSITGCVSDDSSCFLREEGSQELSTGIRTPEVFKGSDIRRGSSDIRRGSPAGQKAGYSDLAILKMSIKEGTLAKLDEVIKDLL